MKFLGLKYFGLIWAGLWRKKTRTVLTMVSVVIAFLLFGLLQGINQGFGHALNSLNVDRLFITSRTGIDAAMPISYLNRIRNVPGVRAVSLWGYFGGYFQDARTPIPSFATDVTELFKIYNETKIRPEYIEAMKRTRTGALVSEELAAKQGWKIGDRVPIGTSIWTNKEGSNTWYFDIVGTFDATKYGMGFPPFYFNYSYFDEARAFGVGQVNYYVLSVSDPTQAVRIAQEIDALFANSSAETRTQTESELAQTAIKQLADVNFIANSIVGAVLFTLLFLTANTMMQSVRERTSELAVLKTLGYSDTKVLTLVLIEALLLCVFAAALGIALSAVVFQTPPLQKLFGKFSMPAIVVLMGAGMALLLAFVSGFPPAWRARQLKIVDALAGR